MLIADLLQARNDETECLVPGHFLKPAVFSEQRSFQAVRRIDDLVDVPASHAYPSFVRRVRHAGRDANYPVA